MISLTIFFNYLGSYYFLFLLIFSFFLLLNEYYKLFNFNNLSINFFVNYTIILINFLFIFYGFNLLPILFTILGVLIGLLLNREKWLFANFSYIYLAFPYYILIYLNNYFLNGKLIILWLLCVVWVCDSSAYIFGSIIKGKKLLPSISPKKTWSGFFSSIILSSLSSVCFAYFLNMSSLCKSLILGLILGVFTSLGDLFESYLKRINNKKDVSKLIPGHGGLLDRLDGFLFAIVVMFFYVLIWE